MYFSVPEAWRNSCLQYMTDFSNMSISQRHVQLESDLYFLFVLPQAQTLLSYFINYDLKLSVCGAILYGALCVAPGDHQMISNRLQHDY